MKENMETMIPGLARLAQIEQQIRDNNKVPDSRTLLDGLGPREVQQVKATAGLKPARVW